ncbi:sensor histidine kinase [Pseudoduganella chitinolytica]|uniref:Oxygen sensor histidine kinase NreB n=1 Tax=Pseudoduganella chitinolytica TaxID=34070 RepID=A0ABY8BGW6_9BURK|nr:sensor histidine kinase [Pseudoduganella chitinolytica]WEF34598.1 sensor histidine kinase [Pseudoduganella chitinolytica]
MHAGPLRGHGGAAWHRCACGAVFVGIVGAPCAMAGQPASAAQSLAVATAALTIACTAMAMTALALLVCWLRARTLARRCGRLALELGREQARRAQAERAWRDSQMHLHRLATARAGAREAERRRIGRDIHDDLGQHLLALHLDIGSLHNHPRLPAWLRERTGLVERHVQQTIRALRNVINDLRPAALEQGLRLALRRQVDEFARLSGLRCHLDVAGLDALAQRSAGTPFATVETALFRLLQEALSNVLRHAAARTVHVTLGRERDRLVLAVRDDGVGLAPGCEARGAGLSGMADRAAAAGGELTLSSRPGRGTTVSIALPLDGAPPPAPAPTALSPSSPQEHHEHA